MLEILDKDYVRAIETGLDAKYLPVLNGIQGQMSDGYWENSRAMEKVWPYFEATAEGGKLIIYVSNQHQKWGYPDNALLGKSDAEVKAYFANKIKALLKAEGVDFSAGNQEVSQWLAGDGADGQRHKVVIGDAYAAYRKLLGKSESLSEAGDGWDGWDAVPDSRVLADVEDLMYIIWNGRRGAMGLETWHDVAGKLRSLAGRMERLADAYDDKDESHQPSSLSQIMARGGTRG